MAHKTINVINSRVHNLKNVCCTIPKNSFCVITGPSGSGKSSLAFDTIYIESQRRFIDSLSSYARYFLGQFQAPDADLIEGLSPAIAIEQKANIRNARSTVGTLTEIYDHLRILFTQIGTLYCPDSNIEIISYTPTQITKQILGLSISTKIIISAPVNINNQKELSLAIDKYLSMGFYRGILNNNIFELESFDKKRKYNYQSFEIIIDRIIIKDNIYSRVYDSVEHALRIGDGVLTLAYNDIKKLYSTKNISPTTLKTFPPIEAKSFSFNSPHGACRECKGVGIIKDFDENLLVIDPSFSLDDGVIKVLDKKNTPFYNLLQKFLNKNNIKSSTPLNQYSTNQLKEFFYGNSNSILLDELLASGPLNLKTTYPGIINWLRAKYFKSSSTSIKKNLEQYTREKTCHKCNGKKLNPFALSVKIQNKNITDLTDLSISDLDYFCQNIHIYKKDKKVAGPILQIIKKRCHFLNEVGLNYLNIGRQANTLSGGELQRIRMANQLGSSLSGVLYVLDEPSIGLHPKDNQGLINTFRTLRDNDNTVIVIEHDQETIEQADYVIDLGPGAGSHGGQIMAQGSLEEIKKNPSSLTGQYLSKQKTIRPNLQKRDLSHFLKLQGATKHNLKQLDVAFPLNALVCITGVSGSGKTTLLYEILLPAVKNYLSNKRTLYQGNYKSIKGLNKIQSIIQMDQGPIGRSPLSNPATYCGFFDDIRNIFASTHEAKIRGYKSSRFSFNIKGGRCEECTGNGIIKVEMQYMPDVFLQCEECSGKRYNPETLSVVYRTKNIADVLEMTIEEASIFFKNHPKIFQSLNTLNLVGLGYLKLGQSATTLSGGEAQRLKISRELSKKRAGHTLYILDEPTTGLHFQDITMLLKILNNLIDQDNSIFVIEHNLDMIKCSDYIIDLGPGGGKHGGQIMAQGTPYEVSKVISSHTGVFLKKHVENN